MSKNRICFMLILSVFVACGASAQVGVWTFEEGPGDMVIDRSGNDHHGTIVDAVYEAGGANESSYAMAFSGQAASRVSVGSFDIEGPGITLACWMKASNLDTPGNDPRMISKATGGAAADHIFLLSSGRSGGIKVIRFRLRTNDGTATTTLLGSTTDATLTLDEWIHTAAAWDGTTMRVFKNGVEAGSVSRGGDAVFQNNAVGVAIGNQPVGAENRPFEGLLDDVVIYDVALSEAEIQEIMLGLGDATLASGPMPGDGATDVARDDDLSWTAGEFANTHNVYIGSSFADVNNASVANPGGVVVAEGLTDTSHDPGRLDFGQTYYWRVDEVNSAPDFSQFRGETWSFTTEPFSIPVAGITATASTSFGISTAEKTIDGSGLTGDLHGTAVDHMWVSSAVPASIEYAFDKAYKLHELWIWNSNQLIESFVGFGAKDVVIEHSLDGATWTAVDGVGPLAAGPGTEDYAHNNTIDLSGVTAQYVRINVNAVQGFAPQASLSEVRFYYIPTFATRPMPESGATGVATDTALAWGRDGREAGSHDVYIGTDPEALTLAGTVTDGPFDTSSADLQVGQTYHWRVDEVNDSEDPSVWTGDVWSFTTVDTIVVDDMEDYADEEFREIWSTWVDGFEDPSNGSLVGNGVTGSPEMDIVHGGGQSLPIHYDNGAAPQSEATRMFASAMNWTGHGVTSLTLYFHGSGTNTGGNLYVKINETKVVYGGDASNMMRLGWNKWTISLADLSGANLSSVQSLTIGVEGGGTGVVYVDDIELTAEGPDLITPAEPVGGLVVHLPFDGDYQDASGNGLHGTPIGAPLFESGASGQGIALNGIDQYVEITGYQGIGAIDEVQQPFTVSNWFKTTENGEMVTWGSSPGRERLSWRIDGGSLRTEHGSGNLRGDTVANDGEWHHGALVVSTGASLRTPATLLYIDGQRDSTFSGSDNTYNLQPSTDVSIGRRATSDDRFFPGSIDEVRIYDRALSDAEVAWLSGRTQAFDKP